MSDSPHIAALKKHDRLNRLSAARRTRIVNGEFERYTASMPDQTVASPMKKQNRAALLEPGDKYADSIFLGVWKPRDRDGHKLKKKFNVFAAPEDLPGVWTYNTALKHVSELNDWHGYNGTSYASEGVLYQALKDGSYAGGWIIPAREMLDGKNGWGRIIMPDNLFAHKDKPAFSNIFTYKDSDGDKGWRWKEENSDLYWSSTPSRDYFDSFCATSFSGAEPKTFNCDMGDGRLSLHCRPVRLEEIEDDSFAKAPIPEAYARGVLIGTWQPKGLSQKFNVYAAPEDLQDDQGDRAMLKYEEVVGRLSALQKWHGYKGMSYANDKELYKALENGGYFSEGSGWFIPPRELLTGTEADGPYGIREGKIIQRDNLYTHGEKDALRDTFSRENDEDDQYTSWYWSSTEEARGGQMWSIDYRRGLENSQPLHYKLNCRPVRLEPVP